VQDKVSALLLRAQFMESPLTVYSLEVRDVSLRDDWAAQYAHEVPVLAAEEGGEEVMFLKASL
jgi:hypothetical protein